MKRTAELITYYVFKTSNNKYLKLENDLENREKYCLKEDDELFKFVEVDSPTDAWSCNSLKDLKEEYLIFLCGKEEDFLFGINYTIYYNHNNIEITGFEMVTEIYYSPTVTTQSYDLSYIQGEKS